MTVTDAERAQRARRAALAAGVFVAVAAVVGIAVVGPRLEPSLPPAKPAQTASAVGPTFTPTPSASAAPSQVVEPNPSRPVATVVSATTQRIRSPLGPRIAGTGVWTGREVIYWGGWPWGGTGVFAARADGAAYDPKTDSWRMLPDAPVGGRARHLAVWTGREMLIWGGYTNVRPKPPAEGAAYNPKTGRWRVLAPAPMNFAGGAASVWADGEWIIAIARDRTDGIEVVAYDPDRDKWRELPRVPGQLSDENELLWTGSELLLNNAADGLYRLAPDAQEWTRHPQPPLAGPIAWTGDRLLGIANSSTGWSLVARDPGSDVWTTIAEAPAAIDDRAWSTPTGLAWTGDRAVLTGEMAFGTNSVLAYDPSTSRWWNVSPAPDLFRSESVVLWAGDRLLMLGGWRGGPGGPLPFGIAYIPAW